MLHTQQACKSYWNGLTYAIDVASARDRDAVQRNNGTWKSKQM